MPYRELQPSPGQPHKLLRLIRSTLVLVWLFRWLGTEFEWARKVHGGAWKLLHTYQLKGSTIFHYTFLPTHEYVRVSPMEHARHWKEMPVYLSYQ